MRGFLLIVLVLIAIMCLSLTGCWSYGRSSTVGYITTVEDTSLILGWDTVWFRVETGTYSSMQSQPEAYAILASNAQLKEALLDTCKNNQKVELIYRKHVQSMAKSNDEVIGFNLVD